MEEARGVPFLSKFLVMEPRQKLGSPDSPSSAFIPPASSKLLIFLSKVHKSSWLARASNIISALSPTKKISSVLWSEGHSAGFGEYPVLIKTTRESTVSGSTLKPQEIPRGHRLMEPQLLVLS